MNADTINTKSIVALLSGIIGIALGGYDTLMYSLIVLVILDYATGVLLAIHEKKLSSDIGFKGISKKALIFVLITTGNIFDQYIIGSGNALRTTLLIFYISNEGVSIIENAGKLGMPLPQNLLSTIKKLNKKNKDLDDN